MISLEAEAVADTSQVLTLERSGTRILLAAPRIVINDPSVSPGVEGVGVIQVGEGCVEGSFLVITAEDDGFTAYGGNAQWLFGYPREWVSIGATKEEATYIPGDEAEQFLKVKVVWNGKENWAGFYVTKVVEVPPISGGSPRFKYFEIEYSS